jgi:hypothetical protein
VEEGFEKIILQFTTDFENTLLKKLSIINIFLNMKFDKKEKLCRG